MILTVVKGFNRQKLHQVPPILQDYAMELEKLGNTPEARENYAEKFEVIRDYCNHVLDIHEQIKKELWRRK